MQTEIEFEHTGTGSAVEKEFTEAGEWESEIEKGGELELEQFWIQKSFCPEFNIRAGHIVVPVGGLNFAHEPLNYFTVYRPEGEYTILPSTWHDTGISLWGRTAHWRYELLVTAGLDGFMFDRDHFVHYGAKSPYEYRVANRPGIAARVDNYSIEGLRIGLSAYYGSSMHNSYPNDLHNTRYADVAGHTVLGALDFAYKGERLIVRGNADYGYVGDATTISTVKRNLSSNNAPYRKTPVGQNALAAGPQGDLGPGHFPRIFIRAARNGTESIPPSALLPRILRTGIPVRADHLFRRQPGIGRNALLRIKGRYRRSSNCLRKRKESSPMLFQKSLYCDSATSWEE